MFFSLEDRLKKKKNHELAFRLCFVARRQRLFDSSSWGKPPQLGGWVLTFSVSDLHNYSGMSVWSSFFEITVSLLSELKAIEFERLYHDAQKWIDDHKQLNGTKKPAVLFIEGILIFNYRLLPRQVNVFSSQIVISPETLPANSAPTNCRMSMLKRAPPLLLCSFHSSWHEWNLFSGRSCPSLTKSTFWHSTETCAGRDDSKFISVGVFCPFVLDRWKNSSFGSLTRICLLWETCVFLLFISGPDITLHQIHQDTSIVLCGQCTWKTRMI